MDPEKVKEIEIEGKKLIEKFSEVLKKIEGKIDEKELTWYVQDIHNVVRNDNEGVDNKFKEALKRNAPKWDEGYVKVDY